MSSRSAFDPRTVARDIPGIFDAIFPRLTPVIVTHFNRTALELQYTPIPQSLISASTLQKAMLFELGFAVGETLLAQERLDWDTCTERAIRRQRRHFDARVPDAISGPDRQVAEIVGRNMASMISELSASRQQPITPSPHIPGFEWVSSGNGDFGVGRALIEVKCSNRNFSASDYRQIVMYWLLSFSASLEGIGTEWFEGILLNPRSGKIVVLQFDDFLRIISGGSTKVDVLQLFASTIGTRGAR